MQQDPGPEISRRSQFERLRQQLEQERSSFIDHWRELSQNILPRGARFSTSDTDRGTKRNGRIIDSTASLSARTLQSGMMSGVTSPARPWFRLTTPDPALNETGSVKNWLYVVSERMSTVFSRSNLYNVLPIIYGRMGTFATAAMSIEEDFDDVVRCNHFALGSFSLACDHKGRVNTFFRTFRMTVDQLVRRFGMSRDNPGRIDWSVFSPRVRDLWNNRTKQSWIDVNHLIAPNDDFDPRRLQSRYKRYISIYYEVGQSATGSDNDPYTDKFLSEKGYDYFPILAPRWEVMDEDVYGTNCPGMMALGDVKQLQKGEERSFEAIDKMVRPPMLADATLKSQKASILPGDTTYLAGANNAGFKPVFQVEPKITELEQKQQAIRDRIKRCYFEDLFLMLSESDRRQITATEIDERKEEKLLALGPVLEQLNQDLLDPLIRITFTLMNRQRMIPPPPPEIRGAPLQVEYISVMAQAQKLIGIESIERFIGFVGRVVQANPQSNAADKVDTDQLVDIYGDMLSVPPGIIRPDEKVQALRQQRDQQQAQAQQQQAIAQASQSAKNLSQADTSGQNMLNQIMQQAQAGNLAPTG